jgi:uncharacterized protein (DUF58 family)
MLAKRFGTAIRNFLVFVLLVGYALSAGGFLPWFLAYVWITLSVVSFCTVRLGIRHLDATYTISAKRLSAGDTISIEVQLKRPNFLPLPWLKVSVQVPPRLNSLFSRPEYVTPFIWHRHEQVTFQLRELKRGRYTIGPMTLVAGDIFGLFSSVRIEPVVEEVTVHPRIVPVYRWLEAKHQGGVRQPSGQSGLDSGSVYGVREYVRGDRLSQIHWRATARTGRLQTKEYESYATSEICIVPDLSQSSFNRDGGEALGEALFELELSIAASLVHDTYLQHKDFSCVFHADAYQTTPRGCSQALLEQILDMMAAASPSCTADFSHTLARAVQDATPGTTLVVVSPCLTERAAAVMAKCVRRLHVEWFVPVNYGSDLSEMTQVPLRLLQQLGVRVHVITSLGELSSLHKEDA